MDKEITSFREQFTAVSLEEKFFNPKHLMNAHAIYDQNWLSWDKQQRRAFFSLVIGYMQRFLPAFYAQAYCRGLYNVLDDNVEEITLKTLNRSLSLANGSIMLPLADGSGLGFDWAICSGRHGAETKEGWPAPWEAFGYFEEFCRVIRQTLLACGLDFQTPERPSANKMS